MKATAKARPKYEDRRRISGTLRVGDTSSQATAEFFGVVAAGLTRKITQLDHPRLCLAQYFPIVPKRLLIVEQSLVSVAPLLVDIGAQPVTVAANRREATGQPIGLHHGLVQSLQ